MAETIRDVIIRVSVQNGAMTLDSSQFVSAMQVVRQEAEQLRSVLGSVGQGMSSGIGDVSQITSVAQAVKDFHGIGNVLNEMGSSSVANTAYWSEMSHGIRGAAESMRDLTRATREQSEEFQQMTSSARIDEFAAAMRAARTANSGTFTVTQRSEHSGGFSGGMSGTRSVGNSSGVPAPDGEATIAAMREQFGHTQRMINELREANRVTQELDAANQALGMTILRTGGLFGVLAGEVYLTKIALDEAHTTTTRYWQSMTDDSMRSARYAEKVGTMQVRGRLEQAQNLPFTGTTDVMVRNFDRQSARESALREYESDPNINPHFKQVRRANVERQDSLRESREMSELKIKHGDEQLKILERSKVEIERNRLERVGAGRNAKASAEEEMKQARYESWAGFGHRQLHRAGHSLSGAVGMNTGIDPQTGFFFEQEEAYKQGAIRKVEAEKDIVGANATAIEKTKDVDQQIQTIKESQAKELGEILSATRQQKQTAYEALRDERQRVNEAKGNFGTSSIERQNIALQLNEVALAIRKKREENKKAGLPEDSNLPQFTQWQLEQDAMGGIAGREQMRQGREKAEKSGMVFEDITPELQKQFDAMKNLPEKEIEQVLAGKVNELNEAGKRIAEKMDQAFNLREIFAHMEKILEDKIKDLELYKQKNRNWFQ